MDGVGWLRGWWSGMVERMVEWGWLSEWLSGVVERIVGWGG